jgi:histidinol dehydrogenase
MRLERSSWDGADARAEAARLRALAPDAREADARAAAIVGEVREGGDRALRELTARLDATDLAPGQVELRVQPEAVAEARSEAPAELVGALEVAARNIESVARAELAAASDADIGLPQGQRVSIVGRPVGAAGVYAPGGRAAYPSSVLMCCIPARVAGVGRVAVASPPAPGGPVRPEVLAACAVAGVQEVYALGGAQAIAAFAYGTETIAPVDVVAGPGSPYVNAAKRLVFGDVGVDGVAGPSELLVVLDAAADPVHLALDLLAQAEHGPDGLLAAVSADAGALGALEVELAALAAARASVSDALIALVQAPDLGDAIDLADAVAPEHLELAIDVVDPALASDRVAGCVFSGPQGAAAFGDYAAGSNHVLPTGGAARFAGPLGVGAFRRRASVVAIGPEAAAGLAPRVAALARAEGFDVHAESAEARGGR